MLLSRWCRDRCHMTWIVWYSHHRWVRREMIVVVCGARWRYAIRHGRAIAIDNHRWLPHHGWRWWISKLKWWRHWIVGVGRWLCHRWTWLGSKAHVAGTAIRLLNFVAWHRTVSWTAMLALAFAWQLARHWLSWALLFGLLNTIFPTFSRFYLTTDDLKSLVSFHDWRQLGWVGHDFDDSLVWRVREKDLLCHRVGNL